MASPEHGPSSFDPGQENEKTDPRIEQAYERFKSVITPHITENPQLSQSPEQELRNYPEAWSALNEFLGELQTIAEAECGIDRDLWYTYIKTLGYKNAGLMGMVEEGRDDGYTILDNERPEFKDIWEPRFDVI